MAMTGPPRGYDDLHEGDLGRPGGPPSRPGRGGRRAVPGDPDDGGGSIRSGITVVMVAVAALTVLGLVALWPRGDAPDLGVQPRTYVDASITDSRAGRCQGIEIPEQLEDCTVYDVELSSGPNEGDTVELPVRPTQTDVPELAEGDEIVLLYVSTSPPGFQYSFVDFQRSSPM